MASLALLAVALVLAIYLFVKKPVDASGKPVDKNTYAFLEGRVDVEAPTESVTNSNIATNFQLLSVYPNIIFGMIGNIAVPLINALAYALGTYLFRRNQVVYQTLLEAHSRTMHGFVAVSHSLPKLKLWTTLVSLSVFTAVVAFEVVFLARILSSVVGGGAIAYYTFVFGFVAFLCTTAYTGGQRTSFFADNYHLVIAYVGIHFALAELLAGNPKAFATDIVLLVIGLITVVMISLRLKMVIQTKEKGRQTLVSLAIALSAAYLLYRILFTLHPEVWAYAQSAYTTWSKSFPTSGWVQSAMILTAICPSIFANFTDFSFWHRMRATSIDTNQMTSDDNRVRVRDGLLVYLIESPLSWVLPVAIGALCIIAIPEVGIALNTPGVDPVSTAIKSLLTSTDNHIRAIGFFLILGFIAVAVSTVDSYLASLSYLYAKDMASSERTESNNVARGRLFQYAVGGIVLVVFIGLDIFIEKTDLLIAIFLAVFAPLAALSPVVVWPLFTGRKYKSGSLGSALLLVSCVLSGVIGFGVGVLAALTGAGPDTLLYWAGVPIAFILAWTFYFAYLATAQAVSTPEHAGAPA